jgi:hypothetical protein
MGADEKLYEAILGLTVSMDALRAELRVGREKNGKRRRARTTRLAAQSKVATQENPVSDIAAMTARRAVKRLGL